MAAGGKILLQRFGGLFAGVVSYPAPVRFERLAGKVTRHPRGLGTDAALRQYDGFALLPPRGKLYAQRVPAGGIAHRKATGGVVAVERDVIPVIPGKAVAEAGVFYHQHGAVGFFKLLGGTVARADTVPGDQNIVIARLGGQRVGYAVAVALKPLFKQLGAFVVGVSQIKPCSHNALRRSCLGKQVNSV